jgi:hypothetical protein
MNAPKGQWKLGLTRALSSEIGRSTVVSVGPITYRPICTLTRLTYFDPEDGGSISLRNVESPSHFHAICVLLQTYCSFNCCKYPEGLVGSFKTRSTKD